MPRFSYTGRARGNLVSGVLEAANVNAIADQLFERGVTPLDIAAEPDADSLALPAWLRPKVTVIDRMLFCRQMHTLLRARVPILRALLSLQESATHPTFRQTLADLRKSLDAGIELSMAFAQHGEVFDNFFVAMVRVGETTGQLEEVFLRLFEHIEFEVFMGQQVKSALRYPMFVIVAMIGAVAVINVMVIPAFAEVFRGFGAQLPLITRLLVGVSHFTVQFGWLLLSIAGALAFAFRHWKKTPEGKLKWDRFLLQFPIAGKIVRKATLARFARSFALAMKSGVPVEQAVSIVAQMAENAWLSLRIEGMRDSVERGESILRAAVTADVFTPMVLQMIAVGEETGAVDEMMNEVADLYSNEVQYELKTLAQQIEPILIVFIGILVLILALGVFLPMWDLGRVALRK